MRETSLEFSTIKYKHQSNDNGSSNEHVQQLVINTPLTNGFGITLKQSGRLSMDILVLWGRAYHTKGINILSQSDEYSLFIQDNKIGIRSLDTTRPYHVISRDTIIPLNTAAASTTSM